MGIVETALAEQRPILKIEGLSSQEMRQLDLALPRLNRLGAHCTSLGLKLLVDAEYTYMNKGISVFALAMMRVFNRDGPVVGNTYQCYLRVILSL